MIKLIDSHAHLSCKTLIQKADLLIKNAEAHGVEAIINICTDKESLIQGLELSKKHPAIFNAAATTPHDVDQEGEQLFELMSETAKSGNLIAVGETGLDYHYSHSEKKTQQLFLTRYLHLAKECGLPIIIHCRDAFNDFFNILDAEYTHQGKHMQGVLHCFTGTLEEAKQVIKRGFYLSLSGIVTFKKSNALQEVAKYVPLDQLLIETDSPYLAPQNFRGKENQPAYVLETAKFIADLKNISLKHLAEVTRKNTIELFKLPISSEDSCKIK